MDIRDILKSFDNLSEATTTTDKGTVHKSGPGGYGHKHGSEDVKDQYGKPIGRMSLGKLSAQNEPKRGKGRPPNPDKPKEYDSTALNKAMGIGKAPKATGKPSVKHSLKEYFDQLDLALNEAGLSPSQTMVPGMQAGGTTAQPTVIDIKNNPALKAALDKAAQQKQITTVGIPQAGTSGSTTTPTMSTPTNSTPTTMEEDGEKWIQGAIKHPGAFTKKAEAHGMTPAQFRAKVLAHKEDYPAKTEKQAQLAKTLSKLKEVQAPEHFAQSSPLSGGGRNPNAFEGKKGVNPFAKKDTKKKPDADKDGVPDWADKKPGKDDNEGKKKGAAPKKGVNPFAKKSEKTKVKEGMDHKLQSARLRGKSHALAQEAYNCHYDDMEEARHYHEGFKEGLDECYGQMPILGRTAVGEMGQGPEVATMASYGADDMGMDEGNAFTAGLAKTPHGGKFKVGGNTFTDRTRYDSNLDEFAFESLDKQLNSLLESEEKVSEGMTVSISKGQQGTPDSVSVSAQDGEADQLLSIIKSAGMGLFGGEEKGFNAPEGSGAHGGISVVDDHDGMMSLMKKLSGNGGETSSGDFADEEGSEEHSEEGHSHEGEEDSCNECGMAYESCGCDHGDEQVVDEEESEDQMAYEVAEANAPDSGAAETAADDASEAGEDAALAQDDAAQDAETAQIYSSPTNEAEDETGEEAGKEEDKKEEMSESSFFNLFKKLSMLSEESTSEKDDKAEKAAKKVAKDIEYDEGHKGKDDNKAEKAGEKVKKDIEYDDKKDKKEKKLDEWANEAGKNGTDAAFEADIDFMTKVISGGLNKQKSTGQTTVPVIAGQTNRMGADGLGNPLKESTDLLKDYRKLSGL